MLSSPSIVPADRLDCNIAECREHADLYKRLSGACGISKDRSDVLKNIARTYVGLAGQLDRLASLTRNEQRLGVMACFRPQWPSLIWGWPALRKEQFEVGVVLV